MKSSVKITEGIIPKDKPVQLKSGTLRRLIHPDTGTSKNVAVSLLVMNPGDTVRPHFHKMREEVYYILSGEGLAIHRDGDKEEEIKLEKNLAVPIPPNVVHDIKCTGDEPLWVLVIMAPPLPVDDAHCAE
jgi:mannose-6-phosphate isomerase-like protein (cupin superfamily)